MSDVDNSPSSLEQARKHMIDARVSEAEQEQYDSALQTLLKSLGRRGINPIRNPWQMIPAVEACLKSSGSYCTYIPTSASIADLLEEYQWLEFFHVGPAEASKKRKSMEDSVAHSREQTVKEAWQTPYMGTAHELLLANIDKMKKQVVYGNMVSVVQSSGTGKSRMLYEMSKLVFTIPFNLRNDWETLTDLAYPPPDSDVAAYLRSRGQTPDEVSNKMFNLLEAIFSRALVQLQALFANRTAGTMTREEIAATWHSHISQENNKNALYESSISQAKGRVNQHASRDDCINSSKALQRKIWELQGIREEARDSEKEYMVDIVLYFDEAHVLGEMKIEHPAKEVKSAEKDIEPHATGDTADEKDDVIHNRLDRLMSCLAHLPPVFSIFMSTVSRMSHLAPVPTLSNSSRQRHDPKNAQTPIIETPFDCHQSLLTGGVKHGGLNLREATSFKHLVRFGRPMFWTIYQAGRVDDQPANYAQSPDEILDLAEQKILCSNQKDLSLHLSHVRIAVLDQVLNLGIGSYTDAGRALQSKLVESHLRIVGAMPSHRQFFHSSYPSEPILSEACLRLLHSFQKSATVGVQEPMNVLLQIFTSTIGQGIVDSGLNAEVAFRLLLLTTYMKANEKDRIPMLKYASTDLKFSRGCLLKTFMETLLVEKLATDILARHPDGRTIGNSLEKAFEYSVVRFTHFIQFSDNSATTTNAMWAAFVRGAAVIGHPQQEWVDLLIPVLLDARKPISEANMSAILFQFKAWLKPQEPRQWAFTHKEIGFFPPPSREFHDHRPYITFICQLGARTGLGHRPQQVRHQLDSGKIPKYKYGDPTTSTPSKLRKQEKIPSRAAPSRTKATPGPVNHHPRYSVCIDGFSGTVYSCISQQDKSAYQETIKLHAFFHDHGRQDPNSQGHLAMMKLFWAACEQCYRWTNDLWLQGIGHRDRRNDFDRKEAAKATSLSTAHSTPEDDPFATVPMDDRMETDESRSPFDETSTHAARFIDAPRNGCTMDELTDRLELQHEIERAKQCEEGVESEPEQRLGKKRQREEGGEKEEERDKAGDVAKKPENEDEQMTGVIA